MPAMNSSAFADALERISRDQYDVVSPWTGDIVPDKISYIKNGKVSRAGLMIARRIAKHRNETDVLATVQKLLDAIDDRVESAAFFDHYYQKGVPPLVTRDTKNGKLHLKSVKPTVLYKQTEEEDGLITSIISTATPDRCNDVMLPGGVNLKNFYGNPVVLWMHNDTIPAIARNVGIQANAQGLIAKTYFNQVTQLSKDLYQLYKNGDMFAFSVGFIPTEWEDEEIGSEENDYGDIQITTPVTQRVYKKWEMLEYSLVNIPMNPEAVALSADPEMAMAKMLRAAVQKGIISAESETLKYFGLDTTLSPIYARSIKKEQEMNEVIEKSGKELSEANANELAAHVHNIEKGLEGIKDFLAGRGYDLNNINAGDDADASQDADTPCEEKALTLEEFYVE